MRVKFDEKNREGIGEQKEPVLGAASVPPPDGTQKRRAYRHEAAMSRERGCEWGPMHRLKSSRRWGRGIGKSAPNY